jgi:hypothetical protein
VKAKDRLIGITVEEWDASAEARASRRAARQRSASRHPARSRRARRHGAEFLHHDWRQMHGDGFAVLGIFQIKFAAFEVEMPQLGVKHLADATAGIRNVTGASAGEGAGLYLPSSISRSTRPFSFRATLLSGVAGAFRLAVCYARATNPSGLESITTVTTFGTCRDGLAATDLAELRATTPWMWLICNRCPHRAPMAFVPLMIRWDGDTSSDKLRRCARCTACGHKGATIQHPGWVDTNVGFQPFPQANF